MTLPSQHWTAVSESVLDLRKKYQADVSVPVADLAPRSFFSRVSACSCVVGTQSVVLRYRQEGRRFTAVRSSSSTHTASVS
jgi:hypothetical protein